MKAVRFTQYGAPSVLELTEVPVPVPAPGEALVRVAGTSFNQVDATIRSGFLRDQFPLVLPHIPGIDLSGTVTAVGDGVESELLGQRVLAFLPMNADGASAEYVVAPAALLAAAPQTVDLADAAALPTAGLTAWQAIVEHAAVQPGQRVLVNGGGGGVGGIAIALAKHLGAHVIATASPRSLDAVRAAGADEIVDYTRTPVIDSLADRVAVVINLVRNSPADLAALRDRIHDGGVLVSTTSPAEPDTARGVRAGNVFVRSDSDQLEDLVSLLEEGVLHLDVSERHDLADLQKVHAAGEQGRLRGRAVIRIAN
ncbi:NADP-dependent oxidoreductase [Promicromonospora sp. NPDC090134]|uniref:NADP-dependent oxidoreductase n=1 Tax=Promicromonospora sp. NPDC090134 TaxID=3364408 RepID=UPI003823805E